MKRFLLLVPLVLLVGCFGRRSKIYIIEEDSVPAQVTQEEPVEVRYVDPTTKEIIEGEKKVVTGYFVLSPQLYRKLVKTATTAMPDEDNK